MKRTNKRRTKPKSKPELKPEIVIEFKNWSGYKSVTYRGVPIRMDIEMPTMELISWDQPYGYRVPRGPAEIKILVSRESLTVSHS